VIIIVVIFTFFVRVTSVDGHSMNPTLKDMDQMLVTNFFYTPKQNDIVVIYAPRLDDGKDIIKRVIGVEGDTIWIESVRFGNDNTGLVYRKNAGEDEYVALEVVELDGVLFEDGHAIGGYTLSQRQVDIEITIPPGYVFVLGDNRSNSTDSRCYSVDLVDVNYIAGRAFLRLLGDGETWGGWWNAFGLVT
jgi:signal peptidase I